MSDCGTRSTAYRQPTDLISRIFFGYVVIVAVVVVVAVAAAVHSVDQHSAVRSSPHVSDPLVRY